MDHQQSKFPKDVFKQFKSKEDFQSFFTDLYKHGVEEMLKGELDEHLGYEKIITVHSYRKYIFFLIV